MIRREHWTNDEFCELCKQHFEGVAEAAVALEQTSPMDGQPLFWGYRDEQVYAAASVIKLAILIELFRHFQDYGLDPQQTIMVEPKDIVWGAGVLPECGVGHCFSLRELARLMIVVSDNTASNLLLDYLGMETVNGLLNRLGLKHTWLRRKFMYPNDNGDNQTCARDCVQLLSDLYGNEILHGPWREEALEILARQQYLEKIPLLLPEKAVLGNKTGELEGVRHDAAIINAGGQVWALAILTRQVSECWRADLAMGKLAAKLYETLSA